MYWKELSEAFTKADTKNKKKKKRRRKRVLSASERKWEWAHLGDIDAIEGTDGLKLQPLALPSWVPCDESDDIVYYAKTCLRCSFAIFNK